MIVVRYADDAVVGFQHCDDAERFLTDLRERFATFGLELAEEKTRLIESGRFAAHHRQTRGLPKPETFEFLGFTPVCARARSGRFKVTRITSKKRCGPSCASSTPSLSDAGVYPSPSKGAGWQAWCEGTSPTSPCPTTARRRVAFYGNWCASGGGRCGVAASVPG